YPAVARGSGEGCGADEAGGALGGGGGGAYCGEAGNPAGLRMMRGLRRPPEHRPLLGFLLVKRRRIASWVAAGPWPVLTSARLPGTLRIHVIPPKSRGAMSCPAPSVASIIA
ncbi:hypothetical protein, partial [Mycolicibacterium frederiksbergense]|uniref:hypothetical protein n=1 Tax=Mycolicibacterium frederiksbergense TaxID=117567 RepID=UPI003F503879